MKMLLIISLLLTLIPKAECLSISDLLDNQAFQERIDQATILYAVFNTFDNPTPITSIAHFNNRDFSTNDFSLSINLKNLNIDSLEGLDSNEFGNLLVHRFLNFFGDLQAHRLYLDEDNENRTRILASNQEILCMQHLYKLTIELDEVQDVSPQQENIIRSIINNSGIDNVLIEMGDYSFSTNDSESDFEEYESEKDNDSEMEIIIED